MEISTIHFEKPKELIKFFLYDEKFNINTYPNIVGKNGYIFRGQADANWSLRPKALRRNTFNFGAPRFGLKLFMHLIAESKAVIDFIKTADDLGIETPINYISVNKELDILYNRLSDENIKINRNLYFPPENLYEEFALAQHYGVPTRFLDWTESPLIACYFAAYDIVFSDRKSDNIAIFSLKIINKEYQLDPYVEIIKTSKFRNKNLLTQKGLFTNIIGINNYFMDHGIDSEIERWPPLECANNIEVLKATLPSNEAINLLQALYSNHDVTRHSLMPSLENAAKANEYLSTLFKQQ